MTSVLRRLFVSDESLIWWLSRLGVFLTAWLASWVFLGPAGVLYAEHSDVTPTSSPFSVWDQWDVGWLTSIARLGYGAAGFENNIAFFPGQPMVVRGLGVLGVDSLAGGLLVSLIAGWIAALALARLAESVGADARWAALAWALSPAAVFLFAPYTEALFAAFAFSAWWAAKKGSWWWAGALGFGASLVRPNGLFLAVALLALALQMNGPRIRRIPPLALPFTGFLVYLAYLHVNFGSWRAWLIAQEQGWQRRLTNPWESLVATWEMAFDNGATASFSLQYRFEIVAMVVLVGCFVSLLVMRWWAEAVYVGLTVISLGTSTLYYSVPRTTLVVFPLWMLLGLLFTRLRKFGWVYLAISVPIMVLGVVGFTQGRWVA